MSLHVPKNYFEIQKEAILNITSENQLETEHFIFKDREDEIIRQEDEAKSLQRQRFGVDGDLFRRREELIQPIQEEIFH